MSIKPQIERDMNDGLVDFNEFGNLYDTTSWAPLNLDAAKVGEGVPPPVFLHRNDGVPLVYAGRRHSFFGPSQTFKTWVALLACKSVIDQDGLVIYIDFEDDEVGFVERARTLGIADEQLGARLLYVHPEEPIEKTPTIDDVAHLRARHPALVVIDGVTEAMSLHGFHPYDPSDTAKYQHLLVRGWNAATIEIDHTGKGGKTGQLGSVQKKAGIDGVSVEFVPKTNRGRDGQSTVKLYVRKDRHGHVNKFVDDKEFLGTFHLDTTPDSPATAYIDAPTEPSSSRENLAAELQAESDLPTEICAWLSSNPGASTGDVKDSGLASQKRTREVLDDLLASDRVRRETGQRGKHQWFIA